VKEGFMHRNYLFVCLIIISLSACTLINTNTQAPTPSSLPSQIIGTPVHASSSTATPPGTQAPLSQATVSPTQEEPTSTPYPTSVLDQSMKDEIDLIQSQVVQERGLQPKYQVPVVLLTTAELRTNVINNFLADYTDEDIADDLYELSIIGLLQANFDLKTLYIDLYSEEIAGYYDNDVKEMFVVSDTGFNGPEHLTYSHEFTHVLQDQNYDIKNGLKYNDDYCETHTEYCAGVQALIEGDATLSEYTWFQNFATTTDQEQVIQFYNNLKSPVYDSAPDFLKKDFVFPYNQGLTFVQDIYDQGGWSAVDAVYGNPPVSTEQILHPALYPSDTPIAVELPDVTTALGDGWREVSRNVMGEWYTYLILADGSDQAARVDDSTAQSAAAGWGGDEYLVMHNNNANTTAFVMKDSWDTANDANQFVSALRGSLNSRFGTQAAQQGNTSTWTYSGGYSSLLISGSTTIWIISPDAATAQTISGLVTP
jgi:hypothetical protein